MSRLAFFRQSGWMMIATVVSGLFMFGVHFFSKYISQTDYSAFVVMQSVLGFLSIPSLGLQMVFARQTAGALTDLEKGQLTSTVHGVLGGALVIWGMAMLGTLVFQQQIVALWKLPGPGILWLTLTAALVTLWKPVFGGLVQGRQNFLWFGAATILEGLSRVAGVALIIWLWRRDSMALVWGVFASSIVSFVVYAWHSRTIWWRQGLAFPWRTWLRNVVPLTLGFGVFQFMFLTDTMFVKSWFEEDVAPYYMVAATLSRALVTFTGPLVWVMFPKIVHSIAAREKTDVFWLGIVVTLGMLSLGALVLSLVAPAAIHIVYQERYLDALPLVRTLPWALVPLGVANVLLNNLMARGEFGVVKWLLLVAGIFVWGMFRFHETLYSVIAVLGVSNLIFLGVLIWYTWLSKQRESSQSAEVAPDGACR